MRGDRTLAGEVGLVGGTTLAPPTLGWVVGGGVIGNTPAFGAGIQGSSPCLPADLPAPAPGKPAGEAGAGPGVRLTEGSRSEGSPPAGSGDWTFDVEEVSAGVYRATGRDRAGRTVEASGVGADDALEKCRAHAENMTAQED